MENKEKNSKGVSVGIVFGTGLGIVLGSINYR